MEMKNISMQSKVVKAEAKPIIRKGMMKMRQEQFNENKGRELFFVNPYVGLWHRWGRREETILTRLRLGHTGLNKILCLIGKHETGIA